MCGRVMSAMKIIIPSLYEVAYQSVAFIWFVILTMFIAVVFDVVGKLARQIPPKKIAQVKRKKRGH
jgi:hypothetical protein